MILFLNSSCVCVTSKQMKEAWDERRTVQHNLRDMGLSDDPNKTLARPVVSLFAILQFNCAADLNILVVPNF